MCLIRVWEVGDREDVSKRAFSLVQCFGSGTLFENASPQVYQLISPNSQVSGQGTEKLQGDNGV